MSCFQTALMWFSLVAVGVLSAGGFAVWCDQHQVFPGRRLLGAFRRLPWLVQFFLLAFSSHLIVHGSIKTNAVGEVEGAAQQRGRDILVACNKAASALFSRDRNVASPLYEIPQPETGRVTANAELAQNWWRRGCWDDWRTVTFEDGWVFPRGTNHLSRVVVMSQGEILASVCDTLPVASLGVWVAHVPFDTCFYHEHTPSNSYRFVWDRAYIERNTNMPLTTAVELFRNGDTCVTTNGVSTVMPYEIPFPHDGIGQDDDWVRANFTNATDILAVCYVDWVDAQVGVDLENGLYKFMATFPDDPPEATELVVGDLSVCVTNAGEYVFVLEKGVEYDFGTNPYDPTVEYSMQDDLMDAPVFANWWWGDDNGVWTVDGGWQWISAPTLWGFGYCFWEPKFCGSPDVTNLSTADFPMTFTALLTDCCNTNGVTYRWSTDDENVHVVSPNARTTLVELDSSFSAETFSLEVEAHTTNRTYYSYLSSVSITNEERSLSFYMPDVLFVNNDDDDGDGAVDFGPQITNEDDVVSGRASLSLSAPASGTLSLISVDGFSGSILERVGSDCQQVFEGASWRCEDRTYDEKTLYFNAEGRSREHRRSQVRFCWSSDEGESLEIEHRFTAVTPNVEPICSERKDVVESGVERSLTLNPCGVGLGRDAYFRIEVLPSSFPDSEIVWTVDGDGSLLFPNGNTGREVRVRGVALGDVELHVQIGDSMSSIPTFPLHVVENKIIKLSVWIVADDGDPVCSEADVRTAIKNADDIYAQVGMSFDVGDRIVITNIPAAVDINECQSTEDHWSYSNLVNVASETGGLEIYVVNSITDDSTPFPLRTKILGLNGRRGLVVAAATMKNVVAHEIGHAVGMEDIYVNKEGVTVGTCCACRDNMTSDWNNGCDGQRAPGSRYYAYGTTQMEIIKRLLMNGHHNGGVDIPAGKIFGVGWQGSGYGTNQVDVGAFVPVRRWQTEHQ